MLSVAFVSVLQDVVVVITMSDLKIDASFATTSTSTTSSSSQVHSTPSIVVGSSWWGGQPVVIQQVDIQASIEASRATVAVS
jgi:hypothetical protein